METTVLIAKFREFFEQRLTEITNPNTGGLSDEVNLNFTDLSIFDPDVAEELTNNPEETLTAAGLCFADLFTDATFIPYIHVINVTDSTCEVKIREIRSKHLGKLCTFTCMIRRKTDVRPKIASIRFECQSCGNVVTMLQLSETIREPSKCGCGGRRFRQLSKELFDAYAFVGEENPEELDAGIELKKMHFFVKKKLADPKHEGRIVQGMRVKITGIPKEAPKISKTGKQKIELDIYIDVISIEILQSEYLNIDITEKDREYFSALVRNPMALGFAQSDVIGVLKESMYSDIEGNDKIKDVLILQNIGGETKVLGTGTRARGDIHILLCGDPGVAKSNLLKIQTNFAPKARYIAGGGASGVGLTGAVARDELMGGWVLDPGALPLTNHGICAVDEFDKMAQEDTDKLHEAMEQQTVTISKASIQATLRAETSVLAGANPKLGRFDEYSPLAKQIDLPPALITRFDYIFVLRDVPNEDRDRLIAKKILSRYRLLENPNKRLDRLTIRKFFAYARTFHPFISENEENEIVSFFVKLRGSQKANEGQTDNGERMPVSPRYIEVVRRTAEAHAKLNLRDNVNIIDVQAAINMILSCLKDVAIDPTTGKFEPDIIDTGYSTTQKAKIYKFSDLLEELNDDPKYKEGIPIDIIIKEARERGLMDSPSEIEHTLDKMKQRGDLWEPRGHGKVKLLK